MSVKDITDYGAVNTANGDWTTEMTAMAADAHGNSSGVGGDVGYIQLPLGKGIWNGPPLNYSTICIKGTDPWHTVLTLNSPLINTTGNLVTLLVENMSLFGGSNPANPISIGPAPDNGGRQRIIRNVEFHGYTGTAISVTGSDTPYFLIENCDFDGAANSIGISFAGYTDDTEIRHNNFFAYKTGLKINAVMQRITVSDNNFMHVGSQGDPSAAPRYDIWIVPSTSAVNNGVGANFINNWHGNEGRATNDYFFVIADDSSGVPVLNASSAGYLRGVQIEGSSIFQTASNQPYIYAAITAGHLQENTFGRNSRRYLPSSAYESAPMLELLSGNVDSTNAVYPWFDLYHPASQSVAALRTNFVDGATDATGQVAAADMNSIDGDINTLISNQN